MSLSKQEETTHSIDLQTLLKVLSGLVEWDTFGALVGVPLGELRRIKEEHGSSLGRRVMHLLDYWVKNDDKVSWSRVIEALKAIPEEKHLAKNVSETYGQTQALESSTDIAQIILKEDEELPRTLEEIRLKFTRLVLNIEKTLKKEVDFDDALSFVCTYLHLTFEPQPENTRQLFGRLQPYYCFMSYKILKLIVSEYLKEAMGERMEKYGNELSNWLESTTVQEFKAAIEKAANPETVDQSPSQCLVVLRLEGEWLGVTLKNLWKLLEYLFGKNSSILTRIRIKEGSVLVHLFAPRSKMLSLLALSSKKYKEMAYLGIRSIQVGGLCFSTMGFIDLVFTFETSLGVAIQNKCHSALIRFLLEIGTDPNGDDPGYTPLILAIISNNMEALSLLMEYNVDVFMFNSRQVSAIHMAAYCGNVDVVNSLLKAGVPPDHHDPFTKFTPLMAAASSDQKKIVKLLLQNGADKDFQSTDGFSALMHACRGSVLTARVLLKAEANPNLKTIAHPVLGTEGGMTALYLACCLYAEDTVKLLLKYHADPNISSDDGRTPLMAACFFRQYKVVNLLLQEGAKVNSQTDHNQGKPTALMIAVYANDTTSVSLMLNANDIDVNLQDSRGKTALYWACRNGNNEMIEHLLKAKADPRLCSHDGESPLLVYIHSTPSSLAKPSIVAALLKAGTDANAFKKTFSITPLHVACFCGHKDDIVQLLLKAKANVNALDIQGYTPLCIAAGKGHEKIVELLISAGADIELEKNIYGYTPLFFAVIMGHLEVIKILIQNRASIKRNRYGQTPQDYAAQMGHMEIFEYLSKASSKKTRAKAKKIISLDKGKTMKTVSKDDAQPSNDDILSYYNNSFSSGPESIKQFQDNKKEYNLESLEATKLHPKIVISSS